MANYKIYVDLDGVLADFTSGVTRILQIVHGKDIVHCEESFERDPEYRKLMWDTLLAYQTDLGGELWYELDLMTDASELWNYVLPYGPEILSATGPDHFGAANQKRKWVPERLGDDIKVNLTRKAADKAQYAAPHHILIDDKEKAINPWMEAGGIGILHTSAENTIRQLKNIGL